MNDLELTVPDLLYINRTFKSKSILFQIIIQRNCYLEKLCNFNVLVAKKHDIIQTKGCILSFLD